MLQKPELRSRIWELPAEIDYVLCMILFETSWTFMVFKSPKRKPELLD